jgi:hypothetical protein
MTCHDMSRLVMAWRKQWAPVNREWWLGPGLFTVCQCVLASDVSCALCHDSSAAHAHQWGAQHALPAA